ncbi:MAG: PTS system mannose/fructose/sorbose family transporter subunit IID [Gemmatimonadales bacterium]
MPTPTQPPVTRLSRAFLRLFTVQGSWNYERLLGVGFGFAEEPLLRDLATDGEAHRAALARGVRFFNSHPYLAGLAVGAAARAEHDGVPPDQVERLRAALCGPLGSVGDRLVWAGWLPFASGLALAAVALGAGWGAIGGFLVLYNVGHVALRWWALRAGWAYGARVAAALHHPALAHAGRLTGPAMALAVGFALPLVTMFLGEGLATAWAWLLAAGVAAGAILLLRWRPDRLSGLRVGLALVAAALVGGWLWP